MRMFCVKILAVVVMLAGLGWLAGSMRAQPQRATRITADYIAADGSRTTTTQTPMLGPAAPEQFHSQLLLDDTNHGGPGMLAVRGVYEVREPNPLGTIDDREYTICVSVRDYQGNTFVDHAILGTVIDRPGVGHWRKEFTWEAPFQPGKYYCEMMAVVPGTEVVRFNGTTGPALEAYSSIHAIVR
jgi:hypothetical protein